jgi:hypothetical protein
MPRPRKDDAERRTAQIGVRYTERELEQLARAAARAGLPVAAYIRQLSLSGRVVVAERRSLDWPVLDELRRIGINLNQAMRVANARGRISPALESAAIAVERFLMQEIERDGPEGRG